jgi:hypothetical protein
MANVTIEIIKNGPYIVKGDVEMKDADGNSYSVEKRMALCRCGAVDRQTVLRRYPLKNWFPGSGEGSPGIGRRLMRSGTLRRLRRKR